MNVEIRHNKALHQTAIPLRSIVAGELGRYAFPIVCTAVSTRPTRNERKNILKQAYIEGFPRPLPISTDAFTTLVNVE